MKKVLLITLHNQKNNFGTVLQSYALYNKVENYGYDVKILDYEPYYANGVKTPVQFIKRTLVNMRFLYSYIRRNQRFEEFIKKQKMTRRYKDMKEIEANPELADIYLIGSDQVWNDEYLCGQDKVYYAGFTESKAKMSYSASAGRVMNSEALDILKRNTEQITYISMREKYSAEQMQENFGRNIEYVLDPVFLLHMNDYKSLIKEKHVQMKGYILAYVIKKDKLISDCIEQVAALTGKKVIQVGGFAKKCDYDYFPRAAGPIEFLELIDNADIVITSSFHGTAFAHIFKKQFLIVMPEESPLRVENILELAGTKNRIVENIDQVSEMLENPIDYASVDAMLDIYRTKSETFLQTSLEDLIQKSADMEI